MRPVAVVMAVLAAVAALLIAVQPAGAHEQAMSQLRLLVNGSRIEGEWEVQERDARLALGLDPRPTGESGRSDFAGHEQGLRDYLAHRLAFDGGGGCPVELSPAPAQRQQAGEHVLVHVVSTCRVPPIRLVVRCDLLFDADPSHQVFFSLEDARVVHAGVFRGDRRSITVEVQQVRAWSTFVEFVREGALHIASGVDHMLFLLALLLPAPLVLTRPEWSPRAGLGPTVREVLKVVTAFTVAHSATLSLSTLGLVAPSARWVDVAIAVSVGAAAWNNLRPFLPNRAWALALAFGLVHGFGFAGALQNLSLPTRARGLALLGFNVGVEIGQVAIVLAILPLLYAASRRAWYPRLVLGVGSFVIVWVAALWTVQRALGLPFFT